MIIATILDESRSMDCIKKATIDGFNEFVSERRNDLESTNKSLKKFIKIMFNTSAIKTEYDNIDDVELLNEDNYCPSGMTALNDAIGIGLDSIKDNKEDEIWFIIITDGMENRSTIYDRDEIKNAISKYKKYDNWNFIFCGANQDSYLSSKEIGMDKDDTIINFAPNAVSVGALYRGISRQVSGSGFEEPPQTYFSEPEPIRSTARPKLFRTVTNQINI